MSFIIPCVNEGENLRHTFESLEASSPGTCEVLVVDNGSTDGSTEFLKRYKGDLSLRLFQMGRPMGAAGALNLGAAFAEGDLLIFIDGHMLFSSHWVEPMLDALSRQEVGLVTPAVSVWGDPAAKGFGMYWTDAALGVDWLEQRSMSPYPVPLAGGCCHGFRRRFFHEIGAYDSGMTGYGWEDLEICLRTWVLGYQVVVVPQVEVAHFFRSQSPYEKNWEDNVYNLLRLVYTHFNAERINRILSQIKNLPSFEEAVHRLNTSDVWIKRRMLEAKRQHNDDWFFATFDLDV